MITILKPTIMGGEIISHKLTHIDREMSVFEACKLRRKSGTTELFVTDEAKGMLFPLGILTTNDIVTHLIAAEFDPAVLTTGDIALSGISATDKADRDMVSLSAFQKKGRLRDARRNGWRWSACWNGEIQ